MDYHLSEQIEHVRQSDLTLAIPTIAFQELREMFGEKVRLIPQFAWRELNEVTNEFAEPHALAQIPRPRLGYLGDLSGRGSIDLLGEILLQHPEWQFISFGAKKWLPLSNEHVIPWQAQSELPGVLRGLDVGFMPYDCGSLKNLHCVPLKLFDYFARGIPVVSTPISFVREYVELVYLGNTAQELARAIFAALAEPPDSPKKARRMAVAKKHSIESLSQSISAMLEQPSSPSGRQ